MADKRFHVPDGVRAEFSGVGREELERLYEELDLPGRRVELYDGRIVVSPSPTERHARIVMALYDELLPLKQRDKVFIHTTWGLYSAATQDRFIPDLLVVPEGVAKYDESHAIGHGARLVAEVVSPGNADADRKDKARTYAQAGVPLYLMVDWLVDPEAVTLFSEPSGARYQNKAVVRAGETLQLPEPIDYLLDTSFVFT